ncbi:uncharacterized protein PpBr36_09194, partial [Pyricularia pennisetigena]|uniref:uncharacterized protein n=1 Tax=Pyricularia pennisetigena TaxID=1578925 RepID=UPI0011544847
VCYKLPAPIFLSRPRYKRTCATQAALLYGVGPVVIHKCRSAMSALSLHNSVLPRRAAFLSSCDLLTTECPIANSTGCVGFDLSSIVNPFEGPRVTLSTAFVPAISFCYQKFVR